MSGQPARCAIADAPAVLRFKQGFETINQRTARGRQQIDRERFRSVAGPLFLADHEAWFKEVFGERYGAYASEVYKSRAAQFLSVMHMSFEALELRGLTESQVEKLEDPCSPLALTVESPALFARRKKVPLYSVRYKNKGKFTTLGFFIYADGGFRYVGNIELGPARRKPESKIVKVEQKARLRNWFTNPIHNIRRELGELGSKERYGWRRS